MIKHYKTESFIKQQTINRKHPQPTAMRRRLTILLLLIATLPLAAAGFLPVVTNYTSLDYRAGLQNWAIAQGDDGEIYIGNNSGVLCFDGYTWTLTPLPGNTTARSLMYTKGRLYVGAYEDFGYMERDQFGHLVYTSLWRKLKDFTPHSDEIWNIVRTRDGHVLFQSFSSWFDFDGQNVTAHYTPRQLPLYFFSVRSNVYVQLMAGSLCRLERGQYREVLSRRQLLDDEVVAMLPLKDGTTLLCTNRHGLLRFDGHEAKPWKTEADAMLCSSQINRATLTAHDSTLVIGTIQSGIYGIDMHGRLRWHYDINTRLCNNTVLRLFYDRSGNVWAALDAGIALIHTGSPCTLLTSTEPQLGMVYDILRQDDRLYIATNQCTYLYKNARLLPIGGTVGQNWHITGLGNQIVVGNNRGTRSISGTQATPLRGSYEASSTCVRRFTVNAENDWLIESSYAEMRIYRLKNGTWQYANDIEGFLAPVRQFEVDDHGVVWATNMNKGLYRIALSDDMTRATSIKYIPSLSDSTTGKAMNVMKVSGNIVISEGEKVFTVGADQNIEPYPLLAGVAEEHIISSYPVDNSHFWLTTKAGYALMESDGRSCRTLQRIPAAFFGLDCGDQINNVKVFDGKAYFCLNGGVGCLDMRQKTASGASTTPLRLASAAWLSADRERHDMPIASESRARAKGDVVLRLSYANFDRQGITFEYSLKGGGIEIKSASQSPEIVLGSLAYGDYTFEARALGSDGRVLGTLHYAFSRPAPLWLSPVAFIVYALLLFVLIVVCSKWMSRRALRKQQIQAEAEQMKARLQLAEQQRIIEDQKKQLLEQQLQDKGKEIASLTMDSLMQKQKVQEVKQELRQQHASAPHDINRMLRHITDNIDNDAYWDIFRDNFDLIHKNFFRHLRSQYPSLTATDLKFCALIRLNLSTKDIAHFTGLTVRGVEGARLRLRKKLGLQKEQSLTEFLIDFK